MNYPLIYFGPPKASTSFIYRAFCQSDRYRQMAVKEWRFLRNLNHYGETGYSERMGVYFNTAEYHLSWKNIQFSYIEHLKYLEGRPSNDLVLAQLRHSQSLIFEKHNLASYFKMFDDPDGFFRIDLDPLNHTISGSMLRQMAKLSPNSVYLSGIRAFIPHVTSLICEAYAWFKNAGEGTLDTPLKNNLYEKNRTDLFCDYMIDVLVQLHLFYKFSSEEEVQGRDSHLSKMNIKRGLADVSYSDSVMSEAVLLYLHTNVALRLKKFSDASIDSSRICYYYSPNVSMAIPQIFSWMGANGIEVGGTRGSEVKRVRESDGNLVRAIFSNKKIKSILIDLAESAALFHRGRISDHVFNHIFPVVDCITNDWRDYCRMLDGCSRSTVINI